MLLHMLVALIVVVLDTVTRLMRNDGAMTEGDDEKE